MSRRLVSRALVVLATVPLIAAPAAASAAGGNQAAFVTHSGAKLLLNGSQWRFSGVDMYWLGLDDNLQDAAGPTYPTHGRIDNGMGAAAALGARLVRAHTLGISVGTPRSVEPTLGAFNDSAFDSIDYAVASAGRSGLRLMVPLTDEWHFYHGGQHTFTSWRGHADIPGANAANNNTQRATEHLFYTDAVVINDFHTYVAHVLDHVNPYTGLRLGDDPTIAIWETGNELWDATPAWTEQMALFIKSHAPRALVADGSAATGMHVSAAAITQPDVDIVGGHFYPTDPAWASADAAVAARNGKAYLVGEFPLTGSGVTAWLSGLAADANVSGDLAWTLLPHLADGTPEPHGDGYTFHNPAATAAEQQQVTALSAHAAAMSTPPTPSGPVNILLSAGVATTTAGPSAYASGTTGSSGAALSTGPASAGWPALRATANSSGYAWIYPARWSDGAPVTPGRAYAGTVTVRRASWQAGSSAGAGHITWYDASGRWLSGSDGPGASFAANGSATLVVTAIAPRGAAWAVPQWQTTQPWVAGAAIDLSQFGISAGQVATPWRVPGQ